MIRHQYHLKQLRIDTQIKIIDEDGTETTAPVVVLVGLNKVDNNQQHNIYKIANGVFNRDFTLDRNKTIPKKPWYKFW